MKCDQKKGVQIVDDEVDDDKEKCLEIDNDEGQDYQEKGGDIVDNRSIIAPT